VKITDIQVDGFGVWTDLEVADLSEQMTVFYGRNEAGKTTLMQFVRTVLYGFSPERRSRYLPPVYGGRSGGSLAIAHAEGEFRMRRRAKPTDDFDAPGELVVSAASGGVQAASFVNSLLADIDESIFNNVFAVGLREIQELGTLDSTEAADQLYKLTSGLDRVSLVDVMRELESSRENVLAQTKEGDAIMQLLRRHDQLRREIEEHTSRGQRWSRIAAQKLSLEEEVEELDETIDQLESQSKLVGVAQGIRDKWEQREDIRQQLEALPKLPAIPERGVEKLEDYVEKLALRKEKIDTLRRQIQGVKDEMDALPINQRLMENAPRIEALAEHAHWINSLQNQISSLHADASTLESELGVHTGKLGIMSSPSDVSGDLPEVSTQTLNLLRAPARGIKEAAQRLSAAQTEVERCRRETEDIGLEIETQLAERGKASLGSSLEDVGKRTIQLRRRIQLEERLEKLSRSRHELERESQDLLEEQVLPFGHIVAIGIPFIMGCVMALMGMVWAVSYAMSLGLFFALLGFGAICVALGFKHLLERSTARELDDCNNQLALVVKQHQTAKVERDELDAALPPGGGSLDARLATAEKELIELEDLLPLEEQRRTAIQRFEVATERLAQGEVGVKESKERWKEALRRVDLPTTLGPKDVKQLSERYDQIALLQTRRETRREELAQRRRELQSVTHRLDTLFADVHLEPISEHPQDQLQQLRDIQTDQQQYIDKRDALKRQGRDLTRELNRHQKSYESTDRKRYALLAEVGVDNETAFRRVVGQHDHMVSLQNDVEDLNAQIRERLGGQVTEEDLAPEFDGRGAFHLERRLEGINAELESAQEQLAALHERKGEMTHEMKTLAEDRSLAEARLELSCLERQLEDAIHRWQVLAAATVVLESIREIYETERQPETLSAASAYLKRLTGGQYLRVWTPLGKDVLNLDDRKGQSLPIDVLSQGTREAVFLAIRLALVDAYAQRGASLPIVLDDVMVNLDADRMKLAAKVLSEFAAKGRQVLLFTCHQHMIDAFHSLKIEVRKLPLRDGAVEPTPPPEIIEFEPEPEPIPEPEPVVEFIPVVVEPEIEPVIEVVEPEPVPQPVVIRTEPAEPRINWDAVNSDFMAAEEYYEWDAGEADLVPPRIHVPSPPVQTIRVVKPLPPATEVDGDMWWEEEEDIEYVK